MAEFTKTDIAAIAKRLNYNAKCDNCYTAAEVAEVVNRYLLLLEQGKIDVYNPNTNSAQIATAIGGTLKPGEVQAILFEMHWAIQDKSVKMPEVATSSSSGMTNVLLIGVALFLGYVAWNKILS